MRRSLVCLLVLTAACGTDGGPVVVRMTVPGADSVAAPVSGATVLALPYDRDSLRQALAAAAEVPRPDAAYSALDSLFAEFRTPFAAYVRASAQADALADSAEAAGADAAVRERLAAARRDQEAARAALDAVRDRVVPATDSLRAVVTQWEDIAYADWANRVEELGRGRTRTPQADTTDARGLATFDLPQGRWWISAQTADAVDPNARWEWNLPVAAGTDTVELSPANATLRNRY